MTIAALMPRQAQEDVGCGVLRGDHVTAAQPIIDLFVGCYYMRQATWASLRLAMLEQAFPPFVDDSDPED